MSDLFLTEHSHAGLTKAELTKALQKSLAGRAPRRVLLIPPDFTRFHSNAGFLTNAYYHMLKDRGAEVDLLPALGTHRPMTKEELAEMYGDIPFEAFFVHNWRADVVALGEVPASYLSEVTGGLWKTPVIAEINRRVLDSAYDLILSVGQVVPHEVAGMANHAKNLFVGVGGSEMINISHMVGAVYGMERMMGKADTPVRRVFDYSMEHFLKERPILFALTVTTAPGGNIKTHGLFIGAGKEPFDAACALAREKNMDIVEKPFKKCVVYLDPKEFKSTWLGNKAIYRTRMAMADGGELIVLAPGVERFGEDDAVDALIRKYGYCGRLKTLELFEQNADLRANMSVAAHLIHGSSDGRFRVTYAINRISKKEIEGVRFNAAGYDETVKTYDPEKLQYGFNTLENGDEVYFIPNPALGLWISRGRFEG
ncbi:MAG: lactate racemase domain-containing protein [Clostridiaceae bacterium]